jgi:GT2 family glycosyltransferase
METLPTLRDYHRVDTISVIIPTLNDTTLPRTIEAVLGQERRADEVVVVGRDERGVTRSFSQVRFVDTGRPVCAAAARNTGIRNSSGALIAFTDSDCIAEPTWLAYHERAHAAGADVVGGGISLEGANFFAQGDNVSMFHDFVSDHPPGERFMLPTLNLSVTRQVIERVGYMDESFPGAAGEDTDWTIRMRLAGYPLRFEPAAVVRHVPSRTRWKDVVRHWRSSGYAGVRVRHRYATEYRTPRIARSALQLRLLSPLIAARVTAAIYANPIFLRHWRNLPLVYATKIVYCLGAAAAVEDGFAFLGGEPDRP